MMETTVEYASTSDYLVTMCVPDCFGVVSLTHIESGRVFDGQERIVLIGCRDGYIRARP